jgi:hypothetical protein
MSDNVIQTSFSAGELAPSIYARTDLAMYHQGLANCRNFFVDYRSGISTRQGTRFVIQCKTLGSRLIPFSVSTTVTYVIEFGDHYCRFYNNGSAVLEPDFAIAAVTTGNQTFIGAPNNNWVNGDWIFIKGVPGIPAMESRYVVMADQTTGRVTDVNGSDINSTGWGTLISDGLGARVYTITSPYAAADLFPNPVTFNPGIKFAESVSVLYITHPSYPPTTLSFFAPTNWVFTTLVFGSTIGSPTNVHTTGQSLPQPGTDTPPVQTGYVYAVTAVDSKGQESLPTETPQFNILNGTGTSVITATALTIGIAWDAVPGAQSYNVYRTQYTVGTGGDIPTIPTNAMLGFLGIANTTNTYFVDSGFSPDFSISPPQENNLPFANGNNPGVVSFFQQRVYYAGSNSEPATFWASQVGAFENFNESNPIQATDDIEGTIVSNQLNQIKHMLPMPGGLIILTGRSAFTLTTGQGANATLAVTPLNATIMPQAYNGSSDVAPIVINEDILYVQAKGSIVRDLSYNIYAAIYTGTDVSIRSNHLFTGHNIIQWTYAEEPFKIVWGVRDDGILLSLTFMKEQQIFGWARHDTLGRFTSVASIQEGQVDAPYVIVERIDPRGIVVQWIERMAERDLSYGCEDAWSVDAGARSALTKPPGFVSVFQGVSQAFMSMITQNPTFSAASIGQVFRAGNGVAIIDRVQDSVTAFMTVVKPIDIAPTGALPGLGLQGDWLFFPGQWTLDTPRTKFFGLDYLVGQQVTINADGGVVAPQVVAQDGSITLPQGATKVTVGLAFTCQAQTMPLDVGEPTVQGKRKKVAAMNFKFANSRGLYVGRTLNTLTPMKDLNNLVPLGQPIPLISGDGRLVVDALYDVPGQVWMQVKDPVPCTILGVVPEVVLGDSK